MHVLEHGPEVPDALAPYLDVDRSWPRHACWVTGHMVAGLDGTAAVNGKVGPLSTGSDQALFRSMRQIADIVMVGAETVRLERYGPVRLSEPAQAQRRQLGQPPNPPVAVVSRSLEFDWTTSVFANAPADAPTHIITCAAADPARRAQAERFATVIVAGDQSVDPAAALRALADLGHRVVLCEGGPTWLGELVAAGCLDELCLSISPLMGGDPLPVCVNPAGAGTTRFGLKGIMAEEDTIFLRYESERETGDGDE